MKQKLLAFSAIAAGLLIIDWILGVGCVSGVLPLPVFLLFNIPFGIVYVFLESSWHGVNYEVGGQIVREDVVAMIELGAVFAQAVFYFVLWLAWQRRHSRPGFAVTLVDDPGR